MGTAGLLAAVVGSGIMGERLAGGNVGLAFLANTAATGAALVALTLALTTVLLACTHNVGRPQMAAALFNALAAASRARAISAGPQPAECVHPEVVAVMREAGLDLAGEKPRRLTPEVAGQAACLITMGCREACPAIPGAHVEDWPIEDPKGQPLERVRAIRDDGRRRVEKLIAANGW